MNRSDLQNLALSRQQDAAVLLANGNYSGAYYLAGYIVECALKACIARQTNQYDFPDKKTVLDSYTHDLEKLVKAANLQSDLDNEIRTNTDFSNFWSLIKEWSEESRYSQSSQADAQAFYTAITDATNGVLQWVSRFW